MLRTMVYKGEQKIYLFHPFQQYAENGTEIVVNSKEEADQLEAMGFKEVKENKTKKKEGEE